MRTMVAGSGSAIWCCPRTNMIRRNAQNTIAEICVEKKTTNDRQLLMTGSHNRPNIMYSLDPLPCRRWCGRPYSAQLILFRFTILAWPLSFATIFSAQQQNRYNSFACPLHYSINRVETDRERDRESGVIFTNPQQNFTAAAPWLFYITIVLLWIYFHLRFARIVFRTTHHDSLSHTHSHMCFI